MITNKGRAPALRLGKLGDLIVRVLLKFVCLFTGILISVGLSSLLDVHNSHLKEVAFFVGALGTYAVLRPVLAERGLLRRRASPSHPFWGLLFAALAITIIVALQTPWVAVVLISLLLAGLVSAGAIALERREEIRTITPSSPPVP
ncbi:MAG TPA: hypothetical protein VGR73_18610 [Bryobacteraceae bacterium]|nr:hypothetical protein [Bryobacteraceae bacterium]